jgi:hypothetical protein
MIKKGCSKTVLVVIVTVAVLASLLVLPVFSANENVVVSITSDPASSGAAPGNTATVPIVVYTVTDLGAGTLSVTYDPSVCTITDVTAADLPILSKNISVPGLALLSAMDTQGHTGDVSFANLELKAAGIYNETSPLDISIETFKTYTGIQDIPATVNNGTFTIVDVFEPSVTDLSAAPAAILNDNGRPRIPGTNLSQLNATVTDNIEVDTVTVDLSPIGGSAEAPMTNIAETDIWTITVNATAGINHTHNLIVTATDIYGNSNTFEHFQLTVLRRGDVIRDNVIDIGDALYIAQYTVGLVPDPGVLVGDVNPATGDETVDIGDALHIAQYTVELVPEP